MDIVSILVSAACLIVGGVGAYAFFRYGLKSKYEAILKEAETEAEVMKKNKLLEVKGKFLDKKAELLQSKERMQQLARQLFAPQESKTKFEGMMQHINTGIAAYDGIMTGMKILRRIRTFFGGRRRR